MITIDYVTETGRNFDVVTSAFGTDETEVDFAITAAVNMLGKQTVEGETIVQVQVREYAGEMTMQDGKVLSAYMQKFIAAI